MNGASTRTNAFHIAKVRLVARLELLVWAFLMLPTMGMFIFFLLPIPIYVLCLMLLALPMDLLLSMFRTRSRPIPAELIQSILDMNEFFQERGAKTVTARRFRYITSDHAAGAHVVGIFFPHVVISAGLLVALQKRDHSAYAIVAHELAHIAHFDRLVISIMALWVLNILSPFFASSVYHPVFKNGNDILMHIVNAIVTLFVISFFSRRREILADTSAALTMGIDRYKQLLAEASRSNQSDAGGFFHPGGYTRVMSLSGNPPSMLRFQKAAFSIYLFYFSVGGLNALIGGGYASTGLAISALCGVAVELSRATRGLAPQLFETGVSDS